MTNTQQTVVEPSADQPHEEVQLTELRPVEQSRINDDRDASVPDGLRALRSFSRRQLVDEFQQFGSAYPKKRKAERWKHLNIAKEFGLDSEEEDCVKKVIRLQGKTAEKMKVVDPINSEGLEDEDEEEGEEEEEEDYYGVNGDFDYLDEEEEEKNEEIYVYRQRDSCSSPEIDDPVVRIRKKIQQKEAAKEKEPETQTKVQAQPSATPRPRGRPRKKKFPRVKKADSPPVKAKEPEPEPESAAQSSESPEKELQSKINDIIQANYLMEQENNNTVDNNLNEVREDESTELDKIKQGKENEGEHVKKYCCVMCKARFKGSGGLRNHYRVVHSTGPLFKCDECGKEFPLKERLKLHVRTHTGFKPYKCPECDKSFARGGQLVQHRRTHSQLKPYRCELCDGTFTCAANLNLHVKRHNGQKDHKCDICGRGFVRRDALKKHLECLHKDVKSFLCHICNKTFKGHLPQHMRTHAQDRPHGCATCGQRFAQKSQLTVHQRTHSGQRPFRCLVCWQAFAHSTALKLHTRRHTGERPFKCAECHAGFTQLPHWKKHMKCIHGRSEPYCCRNCNSFFRIKSDLEAHEQDCLEKTDSEQEPGDGLSASALERFRNMSIEKMRLLLAVLLKRISKQERLDELGFGKRLIDDVLVDSLVSAGKEAVKASAATPEFEALRRNLAVFLEWTVPQEHWENFARLKKTPEEVLETLTAT